VIRRFMLLVLATLVLLAPQASGQPSEVVDSLIDDGFYLEDRTEAEAEAVAAVLAEAGVAALYLVEVTDDVDPLALADDLQRELGSGTVMVVTPFEIGWASDRYTDTEIEAALDTSLSDFDRSPASGLESLAGALSEQAEASGDGSLGWLIPVGLVAIIGGGIWLLVRRSRKERETEHAGRLEEAKQELDGQIAVVSNYIVELSDRVAVAEDDEAESLYREAIELFSGVQKDLPQADELHEMELLSDRLDQARWQLESTEAKLDGKVPPPQPIDRPTKCFFDPNHRAGTEEAEIATAAGSQMVSVCRQCKSRLERGEKVAPRDISVGGRPVPAPRAPRSHGGSGFDWLDGFQILVGGASVGYDIGRSRVRPSRRRSPTAAPSTSRRKTTSTRSSSSRGRRSTGRRSRSKGTRSRGSRRR
jgi:hypothetical protein